MHQSPARHTDPQLKPLLSAIRALLPAHSLKNWSHLYMGLSLSLNAATFPVQAGNAQALPIPISTLPENNEQQVPANSAIRVTFNQAIQRGAGHFIISNGQGDTRRISGLDGNRVSIYADQNQFNNTLFIKPIPSLETNSIYTVSMEDGALTDVLNHPIPAISAAAGLHFTTAPPDLSPPIPVSVTPAHQSTDEANFGFISAIFNEAIKPGIGFITLDNGQGDRQSIAIDNGNAVSFSELPNKQSQLYVGLKRPLLKNSQYTVLVDPGAITDLAGNPYAGLQDKNGYIFKTIEDKTPLALASNNALQADPFGLTLTFNKGIQAGSGSFVLIDPQGNKRSFAVHDFSQVFIAYPGDYEYPTVRINPQGGLLANSSYTLQIPEGVLTDQAGKTYAGTVSMNTTPAQPPAPPDKTPPRLISTIPSENQQQVLVNSNIVVQFDEAVKLTQSGAFVLSNGQGDKRNIDSSDLNQVSYDNSSGKYGPDKTKLVLNPSQDLLANSRYTIQMPAGTVTDTSGNPVQAASLSFTTAADGTPPLALSTNPANESQQVPLDTTITAQFNEAVIAGSGYISLYGGNQHFDFPATDTTNVTFQGNSMIIHPAQPLLPNTQYSLMLYGTPITDLTGNPYVSQRNPNNFSADLTFKTLTQTSTSIPMVLPAIWLNLNRDGLALINSGIFLDFNSAGVQLGSGYLTLSNDQGDTHRIDVKDSTQVHFDGGNLMSILPSKNLLPNAHYRVQIDPGAITDTVGNPYTGIQDNSILNFNTAPAAPPALQQFSLNYGTVYNSTGPHTYPYPVDTSIQVDFDNAIKIGSGNITLNNGQGDIRRIAITDPNQIKLTTGSNFNSSKAFAAAIQNRIEIKPAQALLSNSRYAIHIDAGAVTDLNGLPFVGIQNNNTISFATREAFASPAATNPVQEINRGGTVGVYDNNDVVVFNFTAPVTQSFSFGLSQHSFGGNDVVFSPDGRSASVVLNAASTIILGDELSFNIRDSEGYQYSVTFKL